ncbi:MAG: hypothetical protein GWP08_08160 [Nitrospiraceae bacterium]|nr:hypothetical protein [Nitrospiraceae bacterium]
MKLQSILSLLLVPALLAMASDAMADAIYMRDEGPPYEGRILGITAEGLQLEWQVSGANKHIQLKEIQRITVDGRADFNASENLVVKQEYKKALPGYNRAKRAAGKKWLREYITARQVVCCGQTDRLAQAVQHYVVLYRSNSSLLPSLAAPKIQPKGNAENATALQTIDEALTALPNGQYVKQLKELRQLIASVEAGKTVVLPTKPGAKKQPAPPTEKKHPAFREAPGRMMPVAPEKGIPSDIRGVFDQFYRSKVSNALATAGVDDDARLAQQLFDEARKRKDHPDFAAYALDHVVYLASICPDQQSLLYAALRIQKVSQLRPPKGCLARMMQIASRTADGLHVQERERWMRETWAIDASEYCALQMQAKRFKQAYETIRTLQAAYQKHFGAVPQWLSDEVEGIGFAKDFADACERCKVAVAGEGSHPQEHLFLAIYALMVDKDLSKGIHHLQASGLEEAVTLAKKLKGSARPSQAGQRSFDIGLAVVAIAKKVKGPFPQFLLWQEGKHNLRAAIVSGQLSSADQLQAEMLMEHLDGRTKAIAAKVPRVLREQLERADGGALAHAVGSDLTFFGVSLNQSRKVVYVVDRSGSMTDSIMYVKYELRRSIRALKPEQQFYVVFYSTGPASGMPGGKLVPATDVNKLSAYEFIDSIVPIGQTDPSEALTTAFKARPDIICLLTDGEFDKKIVGLIDRLNRGKKVTVHTFCYIYTGGEAILQQIAKNNGGVYKYIGEDDLESLGR